MTDIDRASRIASNIILTVERHLRECPALRDEIAAALRDEISEIERHAAAERDHDADDARDEPSN